MLQVLGHRRKVNEVKMHRPVPADLQTCSFNRDYMSGAAQSSKREPFLCQALFLHRRQKRWNTKVPTIHFSVNKLTNDVEILRNVSWWMLWCCRNHQKLVLRKVNAQHPLEISRERLVDKSRCVLTARNLQVAQHRIRCWWVLRTTANAPKAIQ